MDLGKESASVYPGTHKTLFTVQENINENSLSRTMINSEIVLNVFSILENFYNPT